NRFNVTVDGGTSPPPAPVTHIAISRGGAPGSVTLGATAHVAVTVRNVGNQSVASSFTVTLTDNTAGATIGTQSVAGVAAGAAPTLNFSWNTTGATTGSHTLAASHDFTDDNSANNSASTSSSVGAPSAAIHVGDLDAI